MVGYLNFCSKIPVTQDARQDSCNGHVDCENGLRGVDSRAHHGNASHCAGPAAALVLCTQHANQTSSARNTRTP